MNRHYKARIVTPKAFDPLISIIEQIIESHKYIRALTDDFMKKKSGH